ncbi:MAG: hypothetical protein HQ583_00765, partial [Candidatus Abyssubacteria bacterium]|nr:hypothetical protein [Candidatus Abyssubacteria bacterium]
MPGLKDMPVKRKLTLVIMLPITLAVLVAVPALLISDLVILRKEMVDNLSAQTNMVAANSAASLMFNDPGSAEELLNELKMHKHIVSAHIFDVQGKIFAKYLRRGMTDTSVHTYRHETGYHFEEGELHTFQPIVSENETVGSVHIVSEQSNIFDHVLRETTMLAC